MSSLANPDGSKSIVMETGQISNWKLESSMKNIHLKERGVVRMDYCGLEGKLKSVTKTISLRADLLSYQQFWYF